MSRYKIIILALSLSIVLATKTESVTHSDPEKKTGALIITLTRLEVGEKSLELQYNIKNGSDNEVWVCDNVNVFGGSHFEVYLADQTLFIHRRHDILPEYDYRIEQPWGHYVRLRAGEERAESLSLTVPIKAHRVYVAGQQIQDTKHAKSINIKIGYYAGDLPGMICYILRQAEKFSEMNLNLDDNLPIIERNFGGLLIKMWLGGLLNFNQFNEGLRSRDDEVLIPYSEPALNGGQVLQITIDGLLIPCKVEEEPPQGRLPYLTPWSRIEIRYKPSMLEYFFPYTGQQSLLNSSEIQHLRSLKSIVVRNQEYLKDLAYDVSKGLHSGIVTEQSTARVICYRNDKYLTSFTVYDNTSIETEEKQWFWYRRGLTSLKTITPQIQPFDLRVRCAANLKDLWHRFCLTYKTEKRNLKNSSSKSETKYPIPTEWCDAFVRAYQTIGMPPELIMRPYICPSVGEGKCHYAMNPNCEYDSPQDMVLLFETKAGWNQHGGPELFTFDNHEPKGGCVLLNDGTVKFIRTKEELHQLRWK